MIIKVARSRSECEFYPDIVQVGKNLWAVCFYLMKMLPARFILDRAEEKGLVHLGSVVVETSSGSFGLSLAHLCNERGYQLILVTDMDAKTARRVELTGA